MHYAPASKLTDAKYARVVRFTLRSGAVAALCAFVSGSKIRMGPIRTTWSERPAGCQGGERVPSGQGALKEPGGVLFREGSHTEDSRPETPALVGTNHSVVKSGFNKQNRSVPGPLQPRRVRWRSQVLGTPPSPALRRHGVFEMPPGRALRAIMDSRRALH